MAEKDLLPGPSATHPAESQMSSAEMAARIREAKRKLAGSKAFDGTENVSSAYGDYLDDLNFAELAKIFAIRGVKEIPFSGFYVGRESIARRKTASGQGAAPARTYLPLHLRTQPVILVAVDGRSTSIRTRLFQPVSSRFGAQGISGGMYHDQAVLENGCWKLWHVNIDEHYFSSPNYKGGWSAAKDPDPGASNRSSGSSTTGYPPDIPLTVLGKRQEGFVGGPGDPIVWPSILPMWFHYRNPVSGRMPEHYWPDCVTCVYDPDTSMQNHGYLLPPN
ncbi:MAG: nuclear transport factor 2 family protein [Acidobacteriota bacterium]